MKALIFAALVLAAPAVSQAPDWSRAHRIAIAMTEEGYTPARLILRRGELYTLRITNRTDKGHNLTQKAFFRSARIAPADRPVVGNGQIVLRAGESAVVHFRAPTTRPGGHYQFSSTTLGDAADIYTGLFVMR